MTPPETLRLPSNGGWSVRVVPNLYPAFERQEVVVHTPRHLRSFAELEDGEVELVAKAWCERRRAEPGGYLMALINEGREAGASLPHTHSQLVWLSEPPPVVASERALGHVLDGTEVLSRDGVTAVCPSASRAPYEALVAPEQAEREAFTSRLLAPALRLVAEVLRRLRAVEGSVPVNAWVHDNERWHIELVPRLTVFAALELGAGLYVNPLPPEEAARRLREASR
jgi:UDPglucose--hexose-1-phosphate uridylyltransferase